MLDLKFLPIHFSIFLIAGIVLGYFIDFSIPIIIIPIIISFFVCLYSYFKATSSFKAPRVFVLFTAILFLFIGILRINLQKPKYQKQHYSKFYQKDNLLALRIDKVLKASSFYNKYEATVLFTKRIKTNGKIIINELKDSLVIPKNVDDILITNAALKPIPKKLNPNTFDYKTYLKNKGIYHQIKLEKNNYLKTTNNKTSLKGLAFKLRQRINRSLKKHHFSQSVLTVFNAILLGQKQEISKKTIEIYKNAGAMHILAISGLHIGILLLFLNLIFKPIENFKKGKILKLILVIIFLWMYAFLAGMSASVIRAVSMFTAIAIGIMSNRPSSVQNSLVVSLFFLLLINPSFLFDVGFQLSYVAVFSIIWVQPLFIKLWKPKFKIINYLWQLLGVSVAAQIGILPLSLYYFHQFPGLFFISSLVIIPFLGIIISIGLVIIFLAVFQILPDFLAVFYGYFIQFMNDFLAFVGSQESFVFKNIVFTGILIIPVYLILISTLQWIYTRSHKKFIIILMAIIILQGTLIFEKSENQRTSEFIVFHQIKNSFFVKREGKKWITFLRTKAPEKLTKNILNAYSLQYPFLEKSKLKNIKNILKINKKNVLIIDSFGVYKSLKFYPEMIILTQSPKINLDRLIQKIKPKIIIADGSNFKSDINHWQKTCNINKVNFYSTSKYGAYQTHY